MIETLKGQVQSTRIVRDGWGMLTILHGSAEEHASVTGHPLGVEVGDTVEVEGQWSQHPKWGRQFKASSIRVVVPSNAAGAIGWILSRLPRIGRKRATEMVERWPLPDLWDVLASRPHELAVIDGITAASADEIGEAYRAVAHERDRIVALRGYGLSDRQAARVVEKWGDAALERLREDPYLLAEEIDGFSFLRSDAVALKMGLPFDHPSRIRAALGHLLGEAAGAGHCYVPAGKLIAMATKLLGGAGAGVSEGAVVREGRVAIEAGRMVQREVMRARPRSGAARAGEKETSTHVYAAELDAAEQSVADSILRLVGEVG